MKNKRLKIIITTILILLIIPFIAMQFTVEVVWTFLDFVVMGILLLSTGLLCEFTIRKVTKSGHRVVLLIAIVSVFILLWVELAVGIFGRLFEF